MKKKIIFITIVSIIIIVVVFVLFLLFLNNKNVEISNKKTVNQQYIETSKRNAYYIYDVDDTLLKKYTNKNGLTMVVVLASWCDVCKSEANGLNTFIKENPNVRVIIVSHDTNKSDLQFFLASNNYNWFVILDIERTIRTSLYPDANSIPYCFILDKDEKVVDMEKGKMSLDEFREIYNKNINK
jgi:thiol-disulfide isomerase/thioredoxin